VVAIFLGTGALFVPSAGTLHTSYLFAALGFSLLRLFIAYVLSVVAGVALGILAESNK
jgi:ABC-type nitrate/sulfonate/bicarbonate transport system permease component